jgi:F-type H+-transporting ATPase subunit b
MKNFCFALCIAQFLYFGQAFGSETGMPQLNPEFWLAQIFWLLLTFFSLYLIIWKVFLPKIINNIENRKHKIVNDLHEAQKLKESAEKQLNEYNKIIENSNKEAKKIIEENRKKLDKDIENKKNKINDEIDQEIVSAETEINSLKKSSKRNISEIANETSAEIIKQLIDTEVNKSNVAAIVDDVIKRKGAKYL